jgi:two-component system response regulator QseB
MTRAQGDLETGRRVLVVEDNDDIRLLLNLWLADDPRCACVKEATGVAEAVAATGSATYDAVVLDFMLGDGTAADCLPQLRRAWPDARIVVYTASLRVAREAGVLDLGADLVVEKLSVVVEDVVDLVLGDTEQPEAAA